MSSRRAVAVLGATSPIARAVALRLAAEGCDLVLVARDAEELPLIAADAAARHGVHAAAVVADLVDFSGHSALVERLIAEAGEGGLEGVVYAAGAMSAQEEAQADFGVARRVIETNYLTAVSLLEPLAAHLEAAGRGFICGISSVAGDRGRQSNYIYGSAKAGFSAYLGGLRQRLWGRGVSVTTVKPGFVDTPMTYGMKGLFLVASPERVGAAIHRAIRRRKGVVYVPWFWWGIMAIIKAIPDFQFRKMKL